MPAWTPLQLGPALWLPTAYLRGMTTEYTGVGTSYTQATSGSAVGRIEDPCGAFRIGAGGNSTRATLNGPGGGQASYLSFGATSQFIVQNSAKLFAAFNRNRLGAVWIKFRVAPHAGTNKTLFDSCNSSGGQIGINARIQSDQKLYWQVTNGTTSILNLASNGVVADNNFHHARLSINASGGINRIDGGTAATAGLGAAAVAADMSSDLYIGQRNSGTQPGLCDIADLIMFVDRVPDDAEYAQWVAFNPEQTSDALFQELVSHQTSLRPNEVTHVYDWFSPTLLPSSVWKDTGRAANVAVDDDAVALIDNRKAGAPAGCSWNRDAIQVIAGREPKWRTNVINGNLPAVYYDGASVSPTSDYTGERNLVISQQPEQNFALVMAFQNLRADDNGSHVAYANGSSYIAACGSGYITNPPRAGRCVAHAVDDTNAANTSVVSAASVLGPEAVNIVIIRKTGKWLQIWLSGKNNLVDGSVFNMGILQYQHIGRPAIFGWDFNGRFLEWYRVAAEAPESTLAKLYNGTVAAHNLVGFPPMRSGLFVDED